MNILYKFPICYCRHFLLHFCNVATPCFIFCRSYHSPRALRYFYRRVPDTHVATIKLKNRTNTCVLLNLLSFCCWKEKNTNTIIGLILTKCSYGFVMITMKFEFHINTKNCYENTTKKYTTCAYNKWPKWITTIKNILQMFETKK
jgi:hypothetical protein